MKKRTNYQYKTPAGLLCLILVMLTLAGLLSLAGCSTSQANTANIITGDDIDASGGADAYARAGDHAKSIYFAHPDYYNMKSNDHLTILSHFKTFQQTTNTSCAAASALMALQHLGVTTYTENDLCVLGRVSVDEDTAGALPGSADDFYEFGAGVDKLHELFTAINGVEIVETSWRATWTAADLVKAGDGFTPNDEGNLYPTFATAALYAAENNDKTDQWVDNAADSYFVKWLTGHIKAGRCVMVEWGDWDGHWQIIIGYDTMGTPSAGDDVIIFADPFDTGDHWQDGYYAYPAERWYYMWKDRNYAPKPFQLQPYIVIEAVK